MKKRLVRVSAQYINAVFEYNNVGVSGWVVVVGGTLMMRDAS